MSLKAVLFDLDDTLLDWQGFKQDWQTYEEPMLRRVFDQLMTQWTSDFVAFVRDFRERTREAWRQGRGTLIAPNLGRILVQSIEAQGVPAGQLSAEDVLKMYGWRAVPGTSLFPEVTAELKRLRDHGLKLAIVTNAGQPMAVRDIEIGEHGLLPYFPECRVSAADAGYLKPHQAIFQRALDQLGVKASEAVFVGDNPVADIAGAQAAGMYAVLRVTHPVPPMLSGLIVPDAAINSLEELPDVLDRLHPGWRPA